MKEETHVLFCRRSFSGVLEGVTSEIFSRGKPPDPQLPHILFRGEWGMLERGVN